MQRNASEIIQFSRLQAAKQMGAEYEYDATVLPAPESIISCGSSECTRTFTGIPGAIGQERIGMNTPALFGTYELPKMQNQNAPRISLTTRFEGGRNTPRGRDGPAPGIVQFDS